MNRLNRDAAIEHLKFLGHDAPAHGHYVGGQSSYGRGPVAVKGQDCAARLVDQLWRGRREGEPSYILLHQFRDVGPTGFLLMEHLDQAVTRFRVFHDLDVNEAWEGEGLQGLLDRRAAWYREATQAESVLDTGNGRHVTTWVQGDTDRRTTARQAKLAGKALFDAYNEAHSEERDAEGQFPVKWDGAGYNVRHNCRPAGFPQPTSSPRPPP